MSKISLKHSGGNVVSLNSPTSAPTSADVAFKLPNADGSAGQFMKTDGSGNLSFDAVAAGGISMIDTYVLSSSQVMSGASWNYLKTNFSRVNGVYGTMNVTGLGTGLGVDNSGSASTFSFPSTAVSYTHLTLPTILLV